MFDQRNFSKFFKFFYQKSLRMTRKLVYGNLWNLGDKFQCHEMPNWLFQPRKSRKIQKLLENHFKIFFSSFWTIFGGIFYFFGSLKGTGFRFSSNSDNLKPLGRVFIQLNRFQAADTSFFIVLKKFWGKFLIFWSATAQFSSIPSHWDKFYPKFFNFKSLTRKKNFSVNLKQLGWVFLAKFLILRQPERIFFFFLQFQVTGRRFLLDFKPWRQVFHPKLHDFKSVARINFFWSILRHWAPFFLNFFWISSNWWLFFIQFFATGASF